MHSAQLTKITHPLRERLYTTTPCRTTRYDDKSISAEVAREWTLAHAAHLSSRCSAPAYIGIGGWQSYTHPEGKRYYALGVSPRIITEVDLMDDAMSEALNAWVAVILEWAAEQDLHFGPSVELFIEPELETGICDYYFADHSSRAVFWLEDATTSELGLAPACSDAHLKLALEENYWKHVEMFCMHLDDLPGALEELIVIYLHGRADLATSSTSTFYFTPEVTDVHLDILIKCRSMPRNPMVFSFIGRLWGYMANARFQNFYGEDHCRLDRTTRVFAHQNQQPGIVSRCVSAAMIGLPQEIRGQLDEQLVDELVIEKVWSGFIASQSTEWQKLMQWTFALIISSALAVPVSPIPVLAHVSLVLSAAALLLAVLLQQHFQRLTKDVDEACAFLQSQKGNMMPLAIVFSLPRAAFIWSLVLFAIQALCILFCAIPFNFGVIFGIILFLIAFGIWRTLNPSHCLVCIPSITRIPILSVLRRREKVKDAESSI
ncbi:hypothetical protein PENSPDRAFT_653691 [Peniophora sp. CONT]|nr:hypothetical protein PENSPDRAFT_653691 [Peniophora sp. CONT]